MYTAYRPCSDDYLADAALMRHMRELALQAAPEGVARIGHGAHVRKALRDLHAALASVRAEERSPALQKAAEAAGFFEPAAFSPAAKGLKDLPAMQGEARIQRIAREILLCSGLQPDNARIEAALRAFAEGRSLRMEELMRLPDALRAECLVLFSHACRQAIAIQREKDAAVRWVYGRGLLRESPVFFEQALRLLREADLPHRRALLDNALARQEGGAQAVLRLAHEMQARVCLRLQNLPGAMRLADAIDPQELLPISDAARILCAAPCYSACDEESRALLRRRIGEISFHAKVSEAEVVRRALDLSALAERDTLRAEPAWYWTSDEGRSILLAQLGRADVRLKKCTPDPKGYRYISAVALLTAGLLGMLFCRGISIWAWPFALVVCWSAGSMAVNAVCTRLFRAKSLLHLVLKAVPPTMRTLVVIPAILPDSGRAAALAAQLEVLAADESDPSVEFALIGDFPDAHSQDMPGDGEVLRAAREAVEAANRRIGSRRIHFLHRRREWNKHSKKWMGYERKRGALQALNRLLLENENAFDADGTDAAELHGRFRYVITLDADTRPYPGALRMLIGTIAHPVNRLSGVNVIQPHMVLSAAGEPSYFARLMGGAAGVNGYGGAVSEVYQDLCGQGGFAGKGIYDITAFDRLAGHALPDNAILSHDLIEGFLAGSAFAGDIVFLDQFPAGLSSYFKRAHRWTRGDWQLLPFLTGRTPLQKYRMLDNLRASLAPLSALVLLLIGLWRADAAALVLALLVPMSGWLFSPSTDGFLRAAAQLSILPGEAHCRTDAALRALHRTFVSRRNMLEWVSAADAEKQAGKTARWPRVLAAAACIVASFAGGTPLSGIVLAAFFLCGAPVLEHLPRKSETELLTEEQKEFLRSLAGNTWRFFAEYTGPSGFPPDNVQFDPPKGAAKRTSPTNIGLYMVSCIAANELGLIDRSELLRRLQATAESLGRIEKWRGMPYNWIDPETGAPLSPRYVSSVDSGNLAASLLLCAQAVRGADPALSEKMESLAREMDLAALFDPVRKLFHIGFDAERGALSSSYYDLLASESRILSYAAIMLRKVPLSHWKRLSRACTAAGEGCAPLSWSGTMFEYLMPGLFLDEPALSLLGEGCRACVQLQMRHRPGGFWGVSESGYYAFDPDRNYQYRAFGLRRLMCKDEEDAQVVSPYSAALALRIAPYAAAENLMHMAEAGFTTPCGLAEAIDFSSRRPEGADHAVVRSAMAHHQGMLLLGCANALLGNTIRDHFALRPDAQAISPLLEEAAPAQNHATRRERPRRPEAARMPSSQAASCSYPGRPGMVPPEGHLICSGGSSLYIQADGAACLHSGGVLVNRWRQDRALTGDGFFTFVREEGSAPVSLLGSSARFSPGLALFRQKGEALDYRLSYSLSPEDGALMRLLTITNRTGRSVRAEVRDIALLSFCTDMQAQDHQSFQDLFVEASYPSVQCLRLIKRPRDEADGVLALDYTVSGVEEGDSCTLIADRPGMLRRGADPSRAQHVFASEVCPREEGAGLAPVQGARILLTVPAHGERIVGFATLVSRRAGRSALPEADRYAQTAALQRAQRLCEEQSREMFRFLDLSAHNARLYGRAAALCMYARPMQRKTTACKSGIGKEALWPLGISGDRPLLLAHAKPGAARAAIEILLLQAYLCSMGVQTDAIVLYSEEEGYSQPLRDDLGQRIAEMRLPGADVYLVSERSSDPRALEAARCLCALELDAEDTLERILANPAHWQALTLPEPADLPAQPVPDRNYGAFSEGGNAYTVRLHPGESTPRAWSNILAGERMGALVSESGGGFLWHENSRSGRLTAFGSDVQSEPAPIRLWIEENEQITELILRPMNAAAQITVRPGETETVFEQNGLRVHIVRCTHPENSVHIAAVRVEAADGEAHSFRLHAACLWQMGVHAQDMRALQTAFEGDCQFAFGSAPFVGCMRLPGSHEQGGHLVLEGGAPCTAALFITAADTAQQAVQLAREADAGQVRALCREEWERLLGKIRIETGETIADAILSRWAPYQAISARLRARTGPNQPGGAYGFRDQLQDVLCLLPVEPMWAREHILLCAAHQFPEGDVQHWWHPPRTGVRTRVSDDLLFLPYVAAHYVLETGDRAVLTEVVPYLSGRPIPPEKHDLYFEPGVSELYEPLREHCMRAIRRVAGLVGKHGLPLMGSGDWNDGMDRIGAQGKGESVWLAQFLCVVARDFAAVCPQYANELQEISHRMLENIERHAWDGDRYLRAFRDDGTPVGSERTEGGCKIDLLAQSWAVFAGCDAERVKIAMDTAISRLYEPEHGILRLLDPPFDGNISDTGYIAAYPPGVRENGGQYTHAACWAMMACAQMDDRVRAWQILRALLPASHAATREQADCYQAEPYAVAADIYACRAAYAGRAGWTWYTGSAGWLQRAFLTGIASLERRGSRVRMCALLDEGMDEMRVSLCFGAATYVLVSGRRYTNADWAELIDDGAEHELYFGAR